MSKVTLDTVMNNAIGPKWNVYGAGIYVVARALNSISEEQAELVIKDCENNELLHPDATKYLRRHVLNEN